MNTMLETIKQTFTVTDHSNKHMTRARVDVGNGYALSVVQGSYSYGGKENLYECAVLFNGSITYDTPLTDDVLGYCSEEDVLGYINQLQEYAATVDKAILLA